jgi:hypothetical protein
MHSRFLPGARTLLALALLTAPTAAQALTYEYLFTPERIQTDRQLYLNLVVQDSGVPRATLEPLLPRMRYVTTDLPIVLFLTRASGKPVDSILTLRTRGLSWAQVFRDLGVGYQPLFVDIDRDPGGPYHTIWTSYRSEPSRLRLTDAQIRDLVDLQLGRKWAGMSAYDLARARARGRSVVVAVADKHGRPYRAAVAGVPPGHGGIPPGHGGVPPGQVKNGVPPGHRRVEGGVVVVKEKDKGQGKGHREGEGKSRSKSKSKGKGEGKAKEHDKH